MYSLLSRNSAILQLLFDSAVDTYRKQGVNMKKNIDDFYPNEENWNYYDGIPPEVAEIHARMTLEEIEA